MRYLVEGSHTKRDSIDYKITNMINNQLKERLLSLETNQKNQKR